MDSSMKSVQVKGGALGYVYARLRSSMETEVVSLLSAKSADSDCAILPLIKGLVVEKDFCTNVAAVSGCKTTGLGGGCGATAKLLPTHYYPSAFAFFGAGGIAPSVASPNLTAACENARKRFGFSQYKVPCPAAEETRGRDICSKIGLDPEATILYLVVTAAFKEAVYLCNAFLHYGGMEVVRIRDEACSIDTELCRSQPSEQESPSRISIPTAMGPGGPRIADTYIAVRIPLYPIQLATPDFNRVNPEPFNRNHRALGEGYEMPKAFFNDALCQLLHGYVLGSSAVGLRVRNMDAVAKGAAHLCLDETHEGIVLPGDTSCILFESEKSQTGNGAVGAPSSPGSVSGFKGKRRGDSVTSVPTQSSDSSGTNSGSSPAGLERRTAAIMASEVAMSMESLAVSSVFDETAYDLDNWPIFDDARNDQEKVSALSEYLARVSGLVGAMAFSGNSVLYLTDVEDSGKPEGKDTPPPSYYRFHQIQAPHLASGQLVDREGRPISHNGDCGSRSKDKPMAGRNGQSSYHELTLEHMAMACGFCPHALAKMLYYLERCDSGASIYKYDADALKHAASSIDSDVPCDLCTRVQKHKCARTLWYRLRNRFPKFGGNQMRGALCLFGAATNNYNDTGPLGNYAPYSSLRKADGEAPRAVIQDTYKVSMERLMADLESSGLVSREDPNDQSTTDEKIKDGKSFIEVISQTKAAAEREASQLIHNLVINRDFKIKEGLADANHTLYISAEPYSTGFCPLLSMLHKRSFTAIIQDLALSQCSHLMHGQQVEARNFRSQFHPVLKKRLLDTKNAGFMTSKQVTVTLTCHGVALPDLTKEPDAQPQADSDCDLAKVTIDVIKEVKIKNKVMFFGTSAASSDAARARAAGMSESFQKSGRRIDVLSGALGFCLKRYHDKLFPNGRPGCWKQPSASSHSPGTAASGQWFWSTIQRNQMPVKMLKKEDVDLISYIKKYTDEYAFGNFINVPPNSIAELAQFTMANTILKMCEHKNFFITAVTSLISNAKRPNDPAVVMPWIHGDVQSGEELEKLTKTVLSEAGENPRAWMSSFSSTNLVSHTMSSKPLMVIAVNVSKYQGISGSAKVFQSGNWASIAGGKNVCSLMGFDRTRKFMLTCPRAGFLVRKTGTYMVKEKTLSDCAKCILEEGGPAPHAHIYMAALKAIGSRVQHLDENDWINITGDQFVAQALCEINCVAAHGSEGWTVESAESAAKDAESRAVFACVDNGEAAFDFDACSGPSVPSCTDESGLFYDEHYRTGNASSICQQAQTYELNAQKRPFVDSLFDMEPAPPEKKQALSVDML